MGFKNRSYICLIAVAILFGLSYIFQNEASYYTGPFTFGFLRYLLATICLVPFVFRKDNCKTKEYLTGGFILALCFLVASGCQQMAAGKTSSGKIGFITSMYIVLVPLLEFVIYKKKLGRGVVLGVIMALVGLGLLCGITDLSFNGYDFLVIFTALAYAFEIIYIDRYANSFDQYKLMFYAFALSTVLFLVAGLVFENLYVSDFQSVIIPVAYLGIGAGAIGYCLQVVGQKNTEGSIASVLMSLESVVSVIAGIVFLKETFSIAQLLGCLLMFAAALICIQSKN